ncbi:hypothetical protein BG004_003008 [Podila humilis]|nr:hypothetical protein BG004_003008 [Podila humilis]
MEWTTAGPAPIPVISKTVVAPPPPSTALFSNLSRQQLEGLKPDGIWRGFGEGYNVKDWGTFSKQAQLEDKNKKLQSSLRSASQSSASSSTSGGVIGTSSSSSNSSNMSYSNASTQGKLEVKPFIPSTRGSAVYELRPVTTTEPQPPPPPPPSHPSAPEDIIEERLLDLSDPIEPDKEVAETPSKINGALSDLIDLEFPTSPPLVEILLDLRFDSGDTGVRGQIFMSAHSVLSTPVSTHNSLHFDQDEDGENDDDDDDDDDNDDDDDDDDGDDNDDDDDDEDDDYDEDEDDEDDALGGMWKQFDQGVVTLTLSTLNKIKMDLESENISWSDLRMQRL